MSFLFSVNWMPFLALDAALIAFVILRILEDRINWTWVILIALGLGAAIGALFQSEGNAWLVWVDLIGSVYVKLLQLLVVPVIFISIVSGFISLNGRADTKKIGIRSVFWLMAQAATAILLSLAAGQLLHIGADAGGLFSALGSLDAGTVGAYASLTKPFDEVLAALFPSNLAGDVASNNVPAVIIVGIAVAAAYLAVAKAEGEDQVKPFAQLIEAVKRIVFKILEVVIDLTPYAVLCLIAGSSSRLLASREAMLQLLYLAAVIYGVCLLHTYVLGGIIVKAAAKLSPIRFFRSIFPAQATAFTTQSSVGTLPVTVRCLKEEVGVSEEAADFTAALGTTIGMPGCTCVWPVLLALFYVHAVGLPWGFGEYATLAVTALFLSVGSAGVPGIAVVSAIALFSALGLPVGAVVLMIPINTISDMIRTLDNVSSASIAAAAVARESGLILDQTRKEEA
ncbi:MAG: dicarboxylate/amino acid:cation symporter [Clostridia bacterium]|nr:dicarboxylate/amino acid:cation symporter [Clostridia bacterium]